MRMKLFDRHGRVRERALTIIDACAAAMRRARRSPHPTATACSSASPIPTTSAARLPRLEASRQADDERFLYLPSLGRVRRIAGSEAQESFVGSDFTYEDIGGREFDDFTYTCLPDDENAAWSRAAEARRVRPGGSNRSARTRRPSFRASSRSC